MIPNRFPDSGEKPEYNTADATLWMFHALDDYLRARPDPSLARETMVGLDELKQVLEVSRLPGEDADYHTLGGYMMARLNRVPAVADQVTAVNILGRRMADTVLLIQALGGGWDRSSLPQRPECCGKLVTANSN